MSPCAGNMRDCVAGEVVWKDLLRTPSPALDEVGRGAGTIAFCAGKVGAAKRPGGGSAHAPGGPGDGALTSGDPLPTGLWADTGAAPSLFAKRAERAAFWDSNSAPAPEEELQAELPATTAAAPAETPVAPGDTTATLACPDGLPLFAGLLPDATLTPEPWVAAVTAGISDTIATSSFSSWPALDAEEPTRDKLFGENCWRSLFFNSLACSSTLN